MCDILTCIGNATLLFDVVAIIKREARVRFYNKIVEAMLQNITEVNFLQHVADNGDN